MTRLVCVGLAASLVTLTTGLAQDATRVVEVSEFPRYAGQRVKACGRVLVTLQRENYIALVLDGGAPDETIAFALLGDAQEFWRESHGSLKNWRVCATGEAAAFDKASLIRVVATSDLFIDRLDPWTPTAPQSTVAQDKRPITTKTQRPPRSSSAEAWAPVLNQLGALVGTAPAGGPTNSAPTIADGAPAAGYSSKNGSISNVSKNGEVVTLADGSAWEVLDMDRLHSALWLSGRVTIIKGDRLGEYLLTRNGKSIRAKQIR